MDKLWAPWRVKYISAKRQKGCIFCACLKQKSKDYVVLRTSHSLAVLNIYPYNNGHVMVAPKKHVGDLSKLNDAEILDLFRTTDRVRNLLDRVVSAQGYNIGINMGKASGAGFPGHLHIHIVPRWKGDTNFMPVVFNTKIISQSLDELLKRLKNADSNQNKRI